MNCFEAGLEIQVTVAGMALLEDLNTLTSLFDSRWCHQGLEPKLQWQPYKVISDWADVSAVLYITVMELQSSLENEAKESVMIFLRR